MNKETISKIEDLTAELHGISMLLTAISTAYENPEHMSDEVLCSSLDTLAAHIGRIEDDLTNIGRLSE